MTIGDILRRKDFDVTFHVDDHSLRDAFRSISNNRYGIWRTGSDKIGDKQQYLIRSRNIRHERRRGRI